MLSKLTNQIDDFSKLEITIHNMKKSIKLKHLGICFAYNVLDSWIKYVPFFKFGRFKK